MVRHTQECRHRGYAFVADPSQQLAWADGEMIRDLVDGADLLFTNEYEAALLLQKTGWSDGEVLDRVGTWVTTARPTACSSAGRGRADRGDRRPETKPVEPTGGGDALRAGLHRRPHVGPGPGARHPAGARRWPPRPSRWSGTQEYELRREPFLERFAAAFGDARAAEIADPPAG
jgi:adenosine kinase